MYFTIVFLSYVAKEKPVDFSTGFVVLPRGVELLLHFESVEMKGGQHTIFSYPTTNPTTVSVL